MKKEVRDIVVLVILFVLVIAFRAGWQKAKADEAFDKYAAASLERQQYQEWLIETQPSYAYTTKETDENGTTYIYLTSYKLEELKEEEAEREKVWRRYLKECNFFD